jgi:vacuolar-type H+-ATPase subunit F/Vma7
MAVAVFIGDEVTAAGYRLCGVDVYVADVSNLEQHVKQACDHASLVLIGSNLVKGLGSRRLDELLASIKPPVLVVPDVRELEDVPDIASRIHKQLGMLE